MNRLMIDTNIYSSFKRKDARIMQILRKAEYIGVSAVVLGELMGGFQCGSKTERNMEELSEFLETPRVFVVEIDEETAGFYAGIYKNLRKKGKPIPSNDMWVAAAAMRQGTALLTLDDHFQAIEGLALQTIKTGD